MKVNSYGISIPYNNMSEIYLKLFTVNVFIILFEIISFNRMLCILT